MEKESLNRRNGYSSKKLKTSAGEVKTIEDILFICMDGVSGLEDGSKTIFPKVLVQRCIVHMIRNSIKYVPNKDYKTFCEQIKKIYSAPGLKAAQAEFEKFRTSWNQYPGAVDVWVRNWKHIEFPSETALLKLLFLRVCELDKKWNDRLVSNWAIVRNQLDVDDRIRDRMRKYDNESI